MYFVPCILLGVIAYLLNKIHTALRLNNAYDRIQIDLTIDRNGTITKIRNGYYKDVFIASRYWPINAGKEGHCNDHCTDPLKDR